MHQATGQYIDTLIHLDVPLDIALSRRLLRDFKDKSKKDLLEDIRYYLNHSRKLFASRDIQSTADLVLDGSLPLDEQVRFVLDYMDWEISREDTPHTFEKEKFLAYIADGLADAEARKTYTTKEIEDLLRLS